MGFFDSESRDHVYNNDPQGDSNAHEGKWSHELIAGAASFEAARAYEQHESKEGKPPSHQLMKELVAGFAGAEVDKLFETKGLDFLDREKAKRQAIQQAQDNINY